MILDWTGILYSTSEWLGIILNSNIYSNPQSTGSGGPEQPEPLDIQSSKALKLQELIDQLIKKRKPYANINNDQKELLKQVVWDTYLYTPYNRANDEDT